MIVARIHGLAGYWRFGAAFLAGSLSVLAHAPFFFWPVLFATFPVLIWLIDSNNDHEETSTKHLFKKAFTIGWAFGFGYFLFGLYWIGKAFLVEAGIFIFLMPIAMTLMPAGLAIFYGLAIAFAATFWRPGLTRILVLAVALASAEWLRGHIFTGFPWNALGYVFASETGLSQLSSIFGPYTLSFFCVLVFASPAIGLASKEQTHLRFTDFKPFFLMAILLMTASLWGHWRLANAPEQNVSGVHLRLVQPNIKQVDKWRPENAGPIYRTMLQLSGLSSTRYKRGLEDVTHLIWPESALPFLMARSKEALDGIKDLLPDHVTLITGSNRLETRKTGKAGSQEKERVVFNSLFVLDSKARITQIYDKKHLVPFGEYLPFQTFLETIGLRKLVQVRGRFEAGQKVRIIQLPNAPPFAPLICYEVVFPQEIVEPGPRPKWLLNLTNDAWYGISTGPHQHFTQARIRAIEQGLPMIRVANTGISAIIDPYGRVKQSLPLAQAGVIDALLPAAIEKTIYARYGTLLFWLVLTSAITLILILKRMRNQISTEGVG